MTSGALDRQGLRALFQAERQILFRFLYRLTGDAADAEDLLQETFLAVWRKRKQFAGRGAAAGYLRRTAYRLFLNEREKKERRRDLLTLVDRDPRLAPPAGAEIERAETRQFLALRVREAIDSLPAPMRETFLLFRYEGLSCAEIAAALDAPAKTIESRVQRATKLLGDKLRAFAKQVNAS